MFRASQCSSSGDRILLIQGTELQFPSDRYTKSHSHRLIIPDDVRINTIRSPDDEHCDVRNM
jgi:hypothetical protein